VGIVVAATLVVRCVQWEWEQFDMVVVSLEDDEGNRCVDLIHCEDGAFCFKEFRRASKMAVAGQ
jgi:hypothetical protein